MVTIKVTYGSNVHKFTIPVESTWAKFESNLRALFKIPDNFKVIASYTDEDDDIITLSSDIELREVLERHSNYAQTSVKLVLNAIPTSKNITQKEIVETLEGLKIVDDEKCYATETETETEKEYDETCNEKCSEEEEETAQSSSDPEIYFFVRSRSKRRPRFGYASFENSSAKCPFRNREFDPHRRHHRQPHGGPFGPFGPFGPHHHGGPHHGGPYYGELHHGEPHHRGNRGFHGHPHPPPPPGFMHKRHFGEFEGFGPHGEFGHFGPFGPHHGGHGYGHGHGHGRFRSRRCHGPRCNRETGSEKECHKEKECKDEKNENDTNDPSVERENHAPSCPPGPSGHAYHGPRSPCRHRSRSRSPVPHDGKEHGNSRMHGHWHGHWHGHHPGFHHRRRHHHHHGEVHGHHHHHKQLTPEELAEKVALLNSMNFPADKNEHYENLLKKFHGRIGRVVEILLCERKRKDGEEPGDDNNDGGSDDDDNNDFEEIKEPTSPITSSTV